MNQLEQRLRQIALDNDLTHTIEDRIVSCGESMSQIILSAYLNEYVSKARQAFDTLQIIGVNVHDQVSKRASKVVNVSLMVHDREGNQCVRVLYSDGFVSKVGEEKKCPIPIPVNSSAAASSCGDKRKADDDHPEAPPAMRQERVGTDRSSVVDETERTAAGDPAEFFDSIVDDTIEPVRSASEVQPEQPPGYKDDCPVLPTGVDKGYGFQFDDFSGEVPRAHPEKQVLHEAGEASSGAPSILQGESERSHHSIKEPDHSALKRIDQLMNFDMIPAKDKAMNNMVLVDYERLIRGMNRGHQELGEGSSGALDVVNNTEPSGTSNEMLYQNFQEGLGRGILEQKFGGDNGRYQPDPAHPGFVGGNNGGYQPDMAHPGFVGGNNGGVPPDTAHPGFVGGNKGGVPPDTAAHPGFVEGNNGGVPPDTALPGFVGGNISGYQPDTAHPGFVEGNISGYQPDTAHPWFLGGNNDGVPPDTEYSGLVGVNNGGDPTAGNFTGIQGTAEYPRPAGLPAYDDPMFNDYERDYLDGNIPMDSSLMDTESLLSLFSFPL